MAPVLGKWILTMTLISCLSGLWCDSLSCDLFSEEFKKNSCLSIFSAFSNCKGRSNAFQALYKLLQPEPEVHFTVLGISK